MGLYKCEDYINPCEWVYINAKYFTTVSKKKLPLRSLYTFLNCESRLMPEFLQNF